MPVLSITEYLALQKLLESRLPERMEALEGRFTAEPNSDSLAEVNASRQSDAERLRAAIADILAEHRGRREPSAKDVLRALERCAWSPLPSVRTVQRHMDSLRHCDTQQCGVRSS